MPGAVAGVLAIRAGWTPASDSATIATRAYDVLTERTPLVGQYSLASRDDAAPTHSLGPLLYWLLALPVRVPLLAAPALAIAAVNTVALVGSARLAFHRGGRALGVVVTVALLVIVRSFGLGQLTSIWNPTAALVPSIALVWVGWAVMCGQRRLLPAVVVLASLVTQCHLTYLLPSLVVAVPALASVLVDAWRARRASAGGAGMLLGVTALVLIACWVAPLVEQVTGDGGNMVRLWQSNDAGERLGLGEGLDVATHMVAGPPPWLRDLGTTELHPDDLTASPAWLARAVALIVVAALVAVTAAAWRRRDRPVLALGATTCGLLVAVVVVTALIPRDRAIVAAYSLWWTAHVGALAWIALGWGLWRAAPTPAAALPRRPALAVAAVIALVALISTPTEDGFAWTYEPSDAFGRAAVDATEPGGRYQVESGGFGVVLPASVGFRLRLAGRDAVLPGSVGPATGEAYSPRGERCDGVLDMVPFGQADPGDQLLTSAVIDQPDLPSERWDLVMRPDEGPPSC